MGLCACVCTSGEPGQDAEWENTRGLAAGLKRSDFLFYPLLARLLAWGWEEAKEERMEPGEYCLPRKRDRTEWRASGSPPPPPPREPHQGLQANI